VKTTTAATLRTQLLKFLDQAEPVMVTHRGRARAILVPVDDPSAKRTARPTTRSLMDLLRQADERITRDGGLSHEEFWRAVDADYAKGQSRVRATRRSK
jgi:antitoxin (DNA-binding transcriptional repressor) of toxin-antitoxin stability system